MVLPARVGERASEESLSRCWLEAECSGNETLVTNGGHPITPHKGWELRVQDGAGGLCQALEPSSISCRALSAFHKASSKGSQKEEGGAVLQRGGAGGVWLGFRLLDSKSLSPDLCHSSP